MLAPTFARPSKSRLLSITHCWAAVGPNPHLTCGRPITPFCAIMCSSTCDHQREYCRSAVINTPALQNRGWRPPLVSATSQIHIKDASAASTLVNSDLEGAAGLIHSTMNNNPHSFPIWLPQKRWERRESSVLPSLRRPSFPIICAIIHSFRPPPVRSL